MASHAGDLLLLGNDEVRFASLGQEIARRIDGAEVLILPTASAFVGPQTVGDAVVGWLNANGVRAVVLDVVTRSDANDPTVAERMRQARAVMATDGSALHVRTTLKSTPVLDATLAAIDDGALLIASGASASALSDPMIDPRGGAPTTGLGPLRSFCVVDSDDEEMLERTLGLVPEDLPVVTIAPGSGLWCSAAGPVEQVGEGNVTVYRAQTTDPKGLAGLGPWWEAPS
jgi:cyanophycinase